jgi:alkylation response protein AidB-like acyl-CoA dehydrogenase
MDLRDSPEEAAFRAEARAWLEANLPEGWATPEYEKPADPAAEVAFLKRWQRQLFDGGWAGLDWPVAYGGRDVGVVKNMIWSEEYTRQRGPNQISLSVGTSLVGPTLIAKGAEWQRERFLAPILRGEEIWCQGFSEPGAGSDLAALRTRGERVGDEIVVTGQKTWTSFAQQADWCILVVRTDPDAGSKHRGLSFLLVDMKTPGITIRPLVEMTGHAWFNEVFFDAARVPVENVVGEIDNGWDIVMTTLAVERGSSAQHARLSADLELLIAAARKTPRGDGVATEDPHVRQQIAGFAAEVMVMKMLGLRNASTMARKGIPGPEGSTMKVYWSELDQRLKAAALEILGPRAMVPEGDPLALDDGYWAYESLWSRAATIYAGTSEVQRNIIATRVLGLPR